MGPAVAVLSAITFHLGTLIYGAIRGWHALKLAAPDVDWGIFEWLRYSCISILIPLILAILLIVATAVITGMGPHDAATPLGGFDTFLTGSWLPDAFGCMALASLFLGLVPYGLIFGVLGFILGIISRIVGSGHIMILQDPLTMMLMTLLVWAGSMVSALKRPVKQA
jgi:hypothetical protein